MSLLYRTNRCARMYMDQLTPKAQITTRFLPKRQLHNIPSTPVGRKYVPLPAVPDPVSNVACDGLGICFRLKVSSRVKARISMDGSDSVGEWVGMYLSLWRFP